MAAAATMMLGSCSDDKLGTEGSDPLNPSAHDGVYFTIRVDCASAPGSRSQTDEPDDGTSSSNSGVEIGKDYENKIGEAIVVLAKASDNSFIAAAVVTNNDLTPITNQNAYQVRSKFSKTQLSAYYKANSENSANIFVFANPTADIRNVIFGGDASDRTTGAQIGDTEWINTIEHLNSPGVISQRNSFFMSNAKIATRDIPRDMTGWENYTSQDKPFDLSGDNTDVNINNSADNDRGNIRIERAAARFDFRDGSVDGKTDQTLNGIGDFTYNVVFDGEVGSANRTPIVNIQLQRMALVNVNQRFYSLPRVSSDGTPTGANLKLCGPELPWFTNGQGGYEGGNYVVDADYTWKNATYRSFAGGNTPSNIEYNTHFFWPFFNNDGSVDNTNTSSDRWASSICSEVVTGEEDNNESWNNPATYGDYRIWKYATENTIAGENAQINGISTGVVFKGKMIATPEALESTDPDIKELAETLNNTAGKLGDTNKDPILYEFAGNLYLTWPKLREAAIKAAVPGFVWTGDAGTGHWEPLSVNRSNSLYMAVFGDGGFGSVTFTYNVVDQSGNVLRQDEITYSDNIGEDQTCANKAWNAWDAAGKPATGALKTDFKQKVTSANITIYQSSNDTNVNGGWGYYCYYYYWNRHNDNGNNGVMGPMEFGVVRNNVYKLAVTKISRLGHPRISENDPNKPEGGTPDESEDVYLTVTAEVLPWVVRINNIEF